MSCLELPWHYGQTWECHFSLSSSPSDYFSLACANFIQWWCNRNVFHPCHIQNFGWPGWREWRCHKKLCDFPASGKSLSQDGLNQLSSVVWWPFDITTLLQLTVLLITFIMGKMRFQVECRQDIYIVANDSSYVSQSIESLTVSQNFFPPWGSWKIVWGTSGRNGTSIDFLLIFLFWIFSDRMLQPIP